MSLSHLQQKLTNKGQSKIFRGVTLLAFIVLGLSGLGTLFVGFAVMATYHPNSVHAYVGKEYGHYLFAFGFVLWLGTILAVSIRRNAYYQTLLIGAASVGLVCLLYMGLWYVPTNQSMSGVIGTIRYDVPYVYNPIFVNTGQHAWLKIGVHVPSLDAEYTNFVTEEQTDVHLFPYEQPYPQSSLWVDDEQLELLTEARTQWQMDRQTATMISISSERDRYVYHYEFTGAGEVRMLAKCREEALDGCTYGFSDGTYWYWLTDVALDQAQELEAPLATLFESFRVEE